MSGDITELLHRWRDGDRAALDEVLETMMPQLRAIAHNKLVDEDRASQMRTTELFNQACVSLLSMEGLNLADRHHFCKLAAQKMHFFLIDQARKRKTKCRDQWTRVELEDELSSGCFSHDLIVILQDALDILKQEDKELYEVVSIRGIAGFKEREAAEILGMPLSSFKRKWHFAKILLASYLIPMA